MVAFWPWSRKDSSPASFEKTLSTLSAKITDTQVRLDRVRSTSRRARVLWTLYLSFAYLVCAIVLLLVIGYKNLGAYEWTGLAGGPVLIFVTRKILSAIYNFRVESLVSRLKEYEQERTKTIQKLKDATKYDSTMELIEKYGGSENSPRVKKRQGGGGEGNDGEGEALSDHQAQSTHGPTPHSSSRRTRMPPPPTANIPRLNPQLPPGTPDSMEPSAEFHPSAEFTPSVPVGQQIQYSAGTENHWYDRLFDVLLGEDETAPKNRIVLICRECRLVNGQAPPGTKTLSELGTWKCMSCGALNGEMDEGKRIINEVLDASNKSKAPEPTEQPSPEAGDVSSDDMVDVAEEQRQSQPTEDDGPAASVRKRRGKNKK